MATKQDSRRGFLGYLTTFLMTGLGLSLAAPAVAYLAGPLWKRGGNSAAETFRDVGAVKDFPVGEWRLVNLELVRVNGWEKSDARRHAIWVRRQAESEFAVLSPICPHLGCPINWHAKESRFGCPCHGGVFDSEGELVSGPPPRGMDALKYEVRGGRLWVCWQDFKIGVSEHLPVKV